MCHCAKIFKNIYSHFSLSFSLSLELYTLLFFGFEIVVFSSFQCKLHKCDYVFESTSCETQSVTESNFIRLDLLRACMGVRFDLLTCFVMSAFVLKILMNDWLPRVADLVDSMISYWKNLVPMKSRDGGRAAILFRCIHSLMSRQVQRLIQRSIDHLYNVLAVYKVSN